jgi:hypothetical protein
MVETPAAALALDTMPIDFASIGSNDLTQYVMAAARDSTGPVAELIDPLDPAVLRLIRLTVEQAAARNLPLSLCGDMASEQSRPRSPARGRPHPPLRGPGSTRPGQALDQRLAGGMSGKEEEMWGR